ncbi:hypothetical protein Lser_V15G24063 [Lactuca serriola]
MEKAAKTQVVIDAIGEPIQEKCWIEWKGILDTHEM